MSHFENQQGQNGRYQYSQSTAKDKNLPDYVNCDVGIIITMSEVLSALCHASRRDIGRTFVSKHISLLGSPGQLSEVPHSVSDNGCESC